MLEGRVLIGSLFVFLSMMSFLLCIFLSIYQFYNNRKKNLTLLRTISISQSFYIKKVEDKFKLKKYGNYPDINSRLKDTIEIFDELQLNKLQLNELKIELEIFLNDPLNKWIHNSFRIGISFITGYIFKSYYIPIKIEHDSHIIYSVLLELKHFFTINLDVVFLSILLISIWIIYEILLSRSVNRTKWVVSAVNYKLMDE